MPVKCHNVTPQLTYSLGRYSAIFFLFEFVEYNDTDSIIPLVDDDFPLVDDIFPLVDDVFPL